MGSYQYKILHLEGAEKAIVEALDKLGADGWRVTGEIDHKAEEYVFLLVHDDPAQLKELLAKRAAEEEAKKKAGA